VAAEMVDCSISTAFCATRRSLVGGYDNRLGSAQLNHPTGPGISWRDLDFMDDEGKPIGSRTAGAFWRVLRPIKGRWGAVHRTDRG